LVTVKPLKKQTLEDFWKTCKWWGLNKHVGDYEYEQTKRIMKEYLILLSEEGILDKPQVRNIWKE
jgi:hypothetical protein